MTSSSRTEPPGCTMADTPAASRISGPSAKGKKASEAATEPAARSPARCTASRQESTRFTCPIPTPTEAPSRASKIAFDFTERAALQANSRSASVSVGGRLTGDQLPIDGPVMISINAVGELDEEPAIDAPALDAAARGRLDHQDSEILLGGEHLERTIGIPRAQ